MTLPAGTQLGSYKILTPLVAAEWNEVYRAKDTRIDREDFKQILLRVLLESVAHGEWGVLAL